jgi:hypothetical protein
MSNLLCVGFVGCRLPTCIRFLVDSYNKPIPAILEIPSKDHSYDPAHNSALTRVKSLFSPNRWSRLVGDEGALV